MTAQTDHRISDPAARVLADPQAYTDETKLHEALAHCRANAPVSWVDVPEYRPFWAITKHADVMEIERQNDLFTNDPRPLLAIAEADDALRRDIEAGTGLRTLIHMDDPHHRDMRKIGVDWFRPKAMRALKTRCDELAKVYVDKMAEKGPDLDFATEIAVNYPLYIILSMLGLPDSDFPRMLKLTQEMFGGNDEEFQRGGGVDDMLAVLLDFFNYFMALTQSRREHPTEDLASAIANARINGEALSDMDTLSYYVIVASAGHDTTSAAIAGGLLALLQNPDQLARLQDDMSLMGTAVEEMIRWVVPVKEFMRTAQADTEVRGVPIAKGEAVLLSYVSANRDEDVFNDPTASTSAAIPTSTCPSATACTSAWAPHWPGWRSTASSPNWSRGSSPSNWPASPRLMATTFVGGLKHLPIRVALT